MNLDHALQYVTAAVTVASILSNFIPAYTKVGKVLHWIALNVRVNPPAPPPADPPAQG